jgi:hypothetical protein
LLLRADIHTLFDLGLIRIHPATKQAHLAAVLKGPAYGELQGRRIRLPKEEADSPEAALCTRRRAKGGR